MTLATLGTELDGDKEWNIGWYLGTSGSASAHRLRLNTYMIEVAFNQHETLQVSNIKMQSSCHRWNLSHVQSITHHTPLHTNLCKDTLHQQYEPTPYR